jgi:hypothetical protein
VEDIQIMVTHGLFSGMDWQALWALAAYTPETLALQLK